MRLLHNERLPPKWLAEALCRQALRQLPRAGAVRVTLDWTNEGGHCARRMAAESGRRFGCEEGFRDTRWDLGFTQARITALPAWSRLLALFALAPRARLAAPRRAARGAAN